MAMFYKLDEDGNPVPADSLEGWRQQKRIALDEVGGFRISTVFLGIDHRFDDRGPPLLFETMVFNNRNIQKGRWDEVDMRRYTTKADAIEGHNKILEKYRNEIPTG